MMGPNVAGYGPPQSAHDPTGDLDLVRCGSLGEIRRPREQLLPTTAILYSARAVPGTTSELPRRTVRTFQVPLPKVGTQHKGHGR